MGTAIIPAGPWVSIGSSSTTGFWGLCHGTSLFISGHPRNSSVAYAGSGFSALGTALENAVLRGELSTTREIADLRIRVERLEKERGQLPQ